MVEPEAKLTTFCSKTQQIVPHLYRGTVSILAIVLLITSTCLKTPSLSGRDLEMISSVLAAFFVALAPVGTVVADDGDSIPDFSVFLMDEASETALARSAAPAMVADAATIMVLTENGYETVIEGTNGLVCYVVRSWGRPVYLEDTKSLFTGLSSSRVS